MTKKAGSKCRIAVVTAFGTALLTGVAAQSGGNFTITESVVANGGGASSGPGFSVSGTAGQSAAGLSSSGGAFTVYSGFWKPQLGPSAASVAVSGRAVTADGSGIRNAMLTLTAPDGTWRFARTASFGYYRFDDVNAGETYVLSIAAKRFTFANPTVVISVTDELSGIDFIAEPSL